MARIVPALLLLFAVLTCLPVYGWQPARPQAGIGLLIISPFTSAQTAEINSAILYQAPGIGRIGQLAAADMPRLHPVAETGGGEYALAVTGKKREWLRIVYDEAGREGWLRSGKFWQYHPWSSFLKGRSVFLLPKLRATSYMLRKECSDKSESLADIPANRIVRIIEVDGDWIKVEIESAGTGYLRWRDNDGRFMISLGRIYKQV